MGLAIKKADHKFTYKEYCSWPDDERWEIIDGIAYNMSPAPSRFHQSVSMKLSVLIANFLKNRSCEVYAAPFDVFFPVEKDQEINSINTVVQPDISVICDKNKLIEKGCFGAPDLIIEILSPWTLQKDVTKKFDLFQTHKVKEYWIIDPGNRFIKIYNLRINDKYDDGELITENDQAINSTVLKDFTITLPAIFSS